MQTHEPREPIAIVGIGCRLPGAASPSELWRLLMDGGTAIRLVPRERVDLEKLYDPRPATPGRSMTKWGGVIDGLESFDAAFFNLSPREAEFVDPSQRLLLETAWEALEDAGIPAETLKGSTAGVFVGLWLNEYESRLALDLSKVDFYTTIGTGRYSASGRISYFLDLLGPSLTVDTACSSSLVAVHLACKSLWTGECSLALAGGANTILEPFITVAYSQSKMMAADGLCKFGDARANGYVRSDGAGLIALERLSDAEAAGHHVYAVILGGAVNNDGRGSGFLATPAQDGQEDLLRKAYRDARVSPGAVQYVEAHGTGTPAGDPVEIGALGAVLAEGRPADNRCRIGSVKTNIGHTEGAAGVAGLIKVALALKHGTIPKSLHFVNPNPQIPWADLPLSVQTEATAWPAGVDRAIAGVSAFGISGTNAHVVLQAHPPAVPAPTTDCAARDRVRLLPLSAQTPEALIDLARAWSSFLRNRASEFRFADICYTAAVRRAQLDHGLVVATRSAEEAAEHLDAFVAGEARPALVSGRRSDGGHKAVFIFPGQGSQWLGMGRGLLRHEPAFAAALERCDAAVRTQTGWSVLEELHADETRSRLAQIDVVQPVLFSIQVALAALWRSWGVEPAAVVGHSMGEVAASHVAGALSIEHAAQIICRRSALLRRTSGKGAMAVVELSLEQTTSALKGYEDRLSVAVNNSPRSTVISGDPAALDALLATLEAREVFCRRVKVDVASHSPQMDPLRADLFAALQGLAPRPADVAFHSTVEARRLDGTQLAPAYWVRNLREPVLFAQTIQQLIQSGHDTFIEMSPHPLLVGAVQEMLRDESAEGAAIASGRRDEDEPAVILSSLAALRVEGVPLPLGRLFEGDSKLVPAPLYPWQRERFWHDRPSDSGGRRASAGDLLGAAFRPAKQEGQTYWEFALNPESVPSLKDHKVRGSVVVPAAFFVEATLDAAARAFPCRHISIEQTTFAAPLVLSDADQAVQVVFSSRGPDAASFRILSRRAADEAEAWVEHVGGRIRAGETTERQSVTSLDERRAQCDRTFDSQSHYAAMNARGLQYGTNYQRVQEGAFGDRVLIARVSQPAPSSGVGGDLQARTATLDGCFQAVVAAIPQATGRANGDTYVPTAIQSLDLYSRPEAGVDVWCEVVLDLGRSAGDTDTIEGDLVVTDVAGTILIEARGFRLFRLERELDAQVRSSLYHLDWMPMAAAPRATTAAGEWLVIGASKLSRNLAARLQARGARVACTVSSADAAAITPALRGVIDASSIEVSNPADTTALTGSISWAQALASSERTRVRLWFITAGAQSVTGEPLASLAGSALWGLRSVIAAEYPQLRCSTVDVSASDGAALDGLIDELLDDGAEDQIAIRSGQRYVLRLRHGAPHNSPRPLSPANGRPYRAVTTSPGILDALTLEEWPRRAPERHEVEIEVGVAALNFMNVMSALGALPGYDGGVGPLGIECAGRVIRTGEAVTLVAPGDLVMAFAHNSLATHAVVHEQLVARIPQGLTLHQAATIPIAFLTAYYSLHHLARVRAGDRVLIHSAASGVGLAALQLAQAAGAEVFATAGTNDKRGWLRARGVTYAGDSRALSFADEIRTLTGGEGIDIVINSLSGEAIPAALGLLRAGGRFVELGKRDIYADRPVGLGSFRRNISYFAVDLDAMGRENPDALGAIFRDCVTHFQSAQLTPLPGEIYPAADVATAFRRMAQGTHSGKILIEIDPLHAPVHARAAARPLEWSAGTYLITGGTGDLGLEMARWMADQGARDLVLMSRRGEAPEPDPRLQALRAAGVRVVIARGDVSSRTDVMSVLDQIATSDRPLRGIVHAAGLLDDATLGELTNAKLQRAFAPKVQGAMHLHELTAELPLDFFVLFSSVAAFIGSAGQSNYAAANACLDALAWHRRASGKPAISINWGPWSDVGLAARRGDRGDRLAARGLESIAPALGVAAFDAVLERNPVQAAVMPFDVHTWCESSPSARFPIFSDLLGIIETVDTSAPAAAASLSAEVLALPPGRRRKAHLEQFLQQQVAQVLKLAPSRIDAHKPLRTMGLDSLMALELRNRLESATGAAIPVTLIWNYPAITQLAPQLAARMQIDLEGPQTSPAVVDADTSTAPSEVDDLIAEIEELSDEDLRRLLAEER